MSEQGFLEKKERDCAALCWQSNRYNVAVHNIHGYGIVFDVWPLTSVTEKEAADPCEQRQSDQVPEAGSDGRGHIVRVDAHLPGSDDDRHHHQTWQNRDQE